MYRFHMFLYIIGFIIVEYLIYSKSESKLWVKFIFSIPFIAAFIIISFKKIPQLKGENFSMSRKEEEIVINQKEKINKPGIEAVSVKEMISTYSAHGYYDILIKANGKKYFVGTGVGEDDKDEILKGLNYFFSSHYAAPFMFKKQ
jgi:hypothetical protein